MSEEGGMEGGKKKVGALLQELAYPSIGETCFQCLRDIIDPAIKTCKECMRSCHFQCINVQGEKSAEVRKHLAQQDFLCRACQQPNKCLECRNDLAVFDSCVHECSICLKRVHHRCHYVPPHIATLTNSRVICQHCLHHFGVKEVVDRREEEGREYVLVRTNHLSPTHSAWIAADSLVEAFRETLEERLLFTASHEVESVLSMHVPQPFTGLTLDEIEEKVRKEEFYQPGRMFQTFKFLIKWRHSFDSFVWQEASCLLHCRAHIIKFLHQLRMGSIAISDVPKYIKAQSLNNCIQSYRKRYEVEVGNCQMRDKEGTSSSCQLRDSDSNERIDLRNVYSLYQKQRKQYLNIKSLSLKSQAVLDLACNIYFIDLNPAPIAIFTDQSRAAWWMTNLLLKSPYLSALALYGPSSHLEKIVRRFMLKENERQAILKFNVLVVSYQSLKVVGSMVNLPQMLDNLSLLVMDEKMTALARYYYSKVKIARIKFHKEIKEEKSVMQLRSEVPEQGNSSQKKSSMTLSTSHIKQLSHANLQQRIQTKASIQSLCQSFFQGHMSNGVADEGVMSEDQRLVFLRFILSFGLNSSDRNELSLRIIRFQPFVFQQSSKTVEMIEKYLGFFLAHLYSLSSNKAFNQSQEELKRYFFSKIHPKRIFKHITRLSRVKTFCELYEKNIQQLQSPIPSSMLGRALGSQLWKSRFDYVICSRVLRQGYGKWDASCRAAEKWRQEHPAIPFTQFLSEVLGKETDHRRCCEFMQKRIQEISEYIEKTVI